MGGCVEAKFLLDNCTDRLRVKNTITQFYTTTICEEEEGTATTISQEQEGTATTISQEQEDGATDDTQNGCATDEIRNDDAVTAATRNDPEDEDDLGAQIAVNGSIASVGDAGSTDSGSEASIVVTAL